MPDQPEPPRLDNVAFRGVSNRLPPRAAVGAPPPTSPQLRP